MRKIGMRTDGTLLGEDDQGALYVGTRTSVPFSEVDHVIEAGVVTYSYKGEVIAKGPTDSPDASLSPCTEWQRDAVEVIDWVRL